MLKYLDNKTDNDTEQMDAIDRVMAQWQRERPELDTLPMAIMGRVMRLNKHLETAVTELHKRYDLKMGEFDVLATLRRAGAPYLLTPSELLASMLLTSGAMTNRLDKLEQKGLIHRLHSRADRRSVDVQLSEQGLQLVDELIEEHMTLQHRLIGCLSEQDRQQLIHCLKHWLANFE